METAKVFWSGRSQAVRLPKNFRFDTDEVYIRRFGNSIVLEPIADSWKWLSSVTGVLDADFEQSVLEQPEEQNRQELEFFK